MHLITGDLEVITLIVNEYSVHVCTADTSPLDTLVDRASKRLYEMLVIGEHVTLKVTSHGTTYVFLFLSLTGWFNIPFDIMKRFLSLGQVDMCVWPNLHNTVGYFGDTTQYTTHATHVCRATDQNSAG